MLTLFYSPGACSLASHIVLEELGVPYEAQRLAMARGEHKEPAFLAINPRGKVPALRLENGDVLTENLAILPWLADMAPEKELLPKEPLARARAMEALAYLATEVHPAFTRVYKPGTFSTEETHADSIREAGVNHFRQSFGLFEDMISESGPFFFGQKMTVVDVLATVFASWLRFAAIPLSDFPRLEKLSAAVLERPAAQRARAAEGLKG